MSKLFKFGLLLGIISFVSATELINIFPMESYNQNVGAWLKPDAADYKQALVSESYQKQRMQEFYRHYYSSAESDLSPWSRNYVNHQLVQSESHNILQTERLMLRGFANPINQQNIVYGENFLPYSAQWFTIIESNMALEKPIKLSYSSDGRAIAVDNLLVRTLPTNDPLFYNSKIAGEGYPFDNLQETAVFIGMPLYVIKQSADKEWSLVIASDDVGWVRTAGIAMVDDKFITTWQKTARKNIVATIAQSSLIDANDIFRGVAYNGSTFPLAETNNSSYEVLIPVADLKRNALIHKTKLSQSSAVVMPLSLTPENIARIMRNQIGKQYGWGSMFFNYDCSAEMKALFAPFGIYLPRNSGFQSLAGKTVILDNLSSAEREQYLLKNGHKLLTLVQIPGHILLYIGNYANPNSTQHELVAMSYQNIWGMKTSANDTRYVIGGSVLLPLLAQYPEQTDLMSFYDSARSKFRLVYLDQFPEN
ncbi:MAG: NlpC-P60 family protein [Neisseriales bacterium]|nr:MAG: NlpC-P60 family protein [Neisseriales bacterium]